MSSAPLSPACLPPWRGSKYTWDNAQRALKCPTSGLDQAIRALRVELSEPRCRMRVSPQSAGNDQPWRPRAAPPLSTPPRDAQIGCDLARAYDDGRVDVGPVGGCCRLAVETGSASWTEPRWSGSLLGEYAMRRISGHPSHSARRDTPAGPGDLSGTAGDAPSGGVATADPSSELRSRASASGRT